jgi:hypothetical protein
VNLFGVFREKKKKKKSLSTYGKYTASLLNDILTNDSIQCHLGIIEIGHSNHIHKQVHPKIQKGYARIQVQVCFEVDKN